MEDVITRFKLETSQYDSKLRDSVKGLKEVVRMNELAGKDFKEFSDRAIEAARALGQQATGATNAKDKVKELVSSYNEMAKSYNFMTEAMKNSEGGKALAASLEQLQQRIKDAKAEMNATPGVLDKLKDKFVINVDALKLFNIGLQAVNGALSVAKDAFFSNEEQLDEWGRTVESCKSVYNGFLDALNTGDISGFLANIDNIVQAARDAYDAIDELGTFTAFNQRNVAKTQRGLTETMVDFREGKATKEQVRAAGDAYKAELQQRMKLENEAYIEAVNNLAQQRGVSKNDLMAAMSGNYGDYKKLKETPLTGTKTSLQFLGPGQAQSVTTFIPANETERLGEALRRLNDDELKSLQALGAQADRTGNEIAQVDRQVSRLLNRRSDGSGGRGGTTATKELDPLQQVQKQIADLSKEALTADDARLDEITKQVSALQEQERAYKQIQDRVRGIYDINAEIEKQYPQRDVSVQQAGPQLSFMDQARQDYALQLSAKNIEIDETTFNSALQVALQNGLDGLDVDFTTIKEKMAEGMDIPDETWEELQNAINEKLAELDIDPIVINFKTGNVKDQAKEMAQDWREAGSAIQAVGSAMQAIEDPAAKVMGTIAQAIATVALTFAKSLEKTFGPWDWIAAAATGVATMVTTISAIKSATAGSYAEGGIVPGNNYNDGLIAHVSSGELILNRAQQNTLATQLTGGNQQAQGGASSTPYVSGEQIFLGLNNYLRRTGRGELVTAH